MDEAKKQKLLEIREKAIRTGETEVVAKIDAVLMESETFTDKATAVGELGMAAVLGAGNESYAGFKGMAAAANPWGEEFAGAKAVEGQRARGYELKNPTAQRYASNIMGNEYVQDVAQGLQDFTRGSGDVGEFIGEGLELSSGGLLPENFSSGTAAVYTALPAAVLEMIGFKGASKVRHTKAGKVDGIPDHVEKKLNDQGIDLADASPEGIEKIRQGVQASAKEELERLQRFESQGIPTTQSRISQSPNDAQIERRLERATDTDAGQAILNQRAAEAEGLQNAVDALGQSAGAYPDRMPTGMLDSSTSNIETGQSIKDALQSAAAEKRASAKQYYEELNALTEGRSVPVKNDRVLNVLAEKEIQANYGKLSSQDKDAVNSFLIEYGFDADPARIQAWADGRKGESGAITAKAEPTPISLSNAEEAIQALNAMYDYSNPTLNAVTAKLKRAIDDAVDDVDINSIDGTAAKETVKAAKKARAQYKALKDFNNIEAITGKLLAKNKIGDDIIQGSMVVNHIFSNSKSASIENISKLMDALEKSPRGSQAVGNIQAALIARLANKLVGIGKLKGDTRTNRLGVFETEINNLMQSGKLQRILQTNPELQQSVMDLYQIARDMKNPDVVAKASGTADDLQNALAGSLQRSDAMRKIAAVLGLSHGIPADVAAGAAANVGKKVANRADNKAAKRALKPRVHPNEVAQIKRLYPELWTAFGTGATVTELQRNQDGR